MNIFFDLDGTLIDARQRLYFLFQQLVPMSKFSFDDYWNLKRNKIGHDQILRDYFAYSAEQVSAFEAQWLTKIEEPEWLAFDKPFQGVTDFLRREKSRHHLFLVTARQHTDRVINQINKFNWQHLFENILVTNQIMEKSELISKSVLVSHKDWIVGDTGKDIESGKKMGVKTAAVLSGFLSKERLIEYNPDVLANSVIELNFL